MRTHEALRTAARTINTDPTLTDQSQAKETDINVIVGRYGIGNTMPGHNKQGIYGDFTNLPTDLRGYIDTARELEKIRGRLPPQLRDKPTEELMALKPEDIKKILTPEPTPAPTPAPQEPPK